MTPQHRIRIAFLATSITALAALGACSKSVEPELVAAPAPPMTLGTQVDDAVITSSVKSVLVADDLVKSLDLQVETRKGVVQLSGFVDSQAQIDQAVSLTRAVAGVTDVENGVTLKGGSTTVGTKIDDASVTGRVHASVASSTASSNSVSSLLSSFWMALKRERAGSSSATPLSRKPRRLSSTSVWRARSRPLKAGDSRSAFTASYRPRCWPSSGASMC